MYVQGYASGIYLSWLDLGREIVKCVEFVALVGRGSSLIVA